MPEGEFIPLPLPAIAKLLCGADEGMALTWEHQMTVTVGWDLGVCRDFALDIGCSASAWCFWDAAYSLEPAHSLSRAASA